MFGPFNAAPIPRHWIVDVLRAEDHATRFEDLANHVISDLEKTPVVGTSKSWDRGRDGRSVGSSSGLFVLTTLESDEKKPERDAVGLRDSGARVKLVYFVSAHDHSELALDRIKSGIGGILGEKVRVEALGRSQLVDLLTRGHGRDALTRLYAGELASTAMALGPLGADDVHLHQLQLALGTFGAKDTGELRVRLGTRLVLWLLGEGPNNLEGIAAQATKRFGIEGLTSVALRQYAEQLQSDGSVVSQDSPRLALTSKGREELEMLLEERAATDIRGQSALRAAFDTSLGRSPGEQEWSLLWTALQNELAKAFYARGMELLEFVSTFLQDGSTQSSRRPLASVVEDTLESVVERHVSTPQREVVLQALKDAFYPGSEHGAFEWLADIAGRFAAICTLGLPSDVSAAVRTALQSIRFFFDSDVVISYLCAYEPAHIGAHALVEFTQGLGHQIMITDSVAEEVARHAMKAHVDYRIRVASRRVPLTWYEIGDLESAFSRDFEFMRLEGKVRAEQWQRYIERLAGREQWTAEGALRPNTPLMRQILSRDRFIIRSPQASDASWEKKRDELATQIHRQNSTGQSEEVVRILQDKARIDAEMLLAVSRAMAEAESEGKGQRFLLVSSAGRLRRLSQGVKAGLPHVADVISLPEAVCLASMLPGRAISLKAMQGLLFEGHFGKSVRGLEARLLRIVRETSSVVLPGASRGVLLQEFSTAIVREATARGEKREDVRDRIDRDPVAFARVAAAAIDALGLRKRSDQETMIRQIEELAQSTGGSSQALSQLSPGDKKK